MVYLMLNRASFAISLDEFAEFTISLNSAFESLVNHPNILFTLERNDETGDERRAFVYVDSQEDEFVNWKCANSTIVWYNIRITTD